MQNEICSNTDGKFEPREDEYDTNIRYDCFNSKVITDERNLLFINDKGASVRLSQFATITESSGPSQLERRDKSTAVTIQAQTVGRPTGTVAAEWQKAFEQLPRPVGVGFVWGGDMENQSEGFGSMGIALIAA